MTDGLSGEEQAIYFSKVRKFFDSYACSRVMGRRTPTMTDDCLKCKKDANPEDCEEYEAEEDND